LEVDAVNMCGLWDKWWPVIAALRYSWYSNQKEEIRRLQSANRDLERRCEEAETAVKKAENFAFYGDDVIASEQELPVISKTLEMFDNLYTQQRQTANRKLKKWLKKTKNYRKAYIAQKMHEVMFNVLIWSYEEVRRFQDEEMFLKAAKALRMETANDDEKDVHFGVEQRAGLVISSRDIIRKRFDDHFKMNCDKILDQVQSIMARNVMEKTLRENADCFEDLGEEEELTALEDFVNECCRVCWIMILQDPPLELDPMEWKGRGETFMKSEHNKFKGSNTESNKVLYYVWPVITDRRGNAETDQKKMIMVRDAFEPEPTSEVVLEISDDV